MRFLKIVEGRSVGAPNLIAPHQMGTILKKSPFQPFKDIPFTIEQFASREDIPFARLDHVIPESHLVLKF